MKNRLENIITIMDIIKIVYVTVMLLTLTVAAAQNVDDVQSSEFPVESGRLTSWDNIVKGNIGNSHATEIPMGFQIDKIKLQDIKRKPVIHPSNIIPTIEKDTSISTIESLASNLIYNFESLNDNSNTDGYFHRPPDPTIAAGSNHIGVMVNSMVAFYTKDGTLVREANLANWFNNVCINCMPFDPRIIYDPLENRWIMLAIESHSVTKESWYLLSVSQTSDPTGNWWNYKLNGGLDISSGITRGKRPQTTKTWADYPDVGFDGIPSQGKGAIYITSNQFTWSSPNTFMTSMLNVIPKSSLYAGTGLTVWRAWGKTNSDGSSAFTLRSAKTYGNPGGEFLINSISDGGDSVTLWNVNPTTSPPTWTRKATIQIGSYSPPPDAQQGGCAATLDTIDNRIYNAVYQNGKLYAAFTEVNNFGSGNVAAIRYLAINTTSNTPQINGRYGSDGYYYWFPAITADNSDNITMTFARSSPTEYAGIYFTGRSNTDSSAQPSSLLKAGEICVTGSRWGDYFGVGNDPSDNSVWIYGEWAKNLNLPSTYSDWNWGTWIGRVAN